MRFWNNSTCTQALDMFMSYFCKINRVYVSFSRSKFDFRQVGYDDVYQVININVQYSAFCAFFFSENTFQNILTYIIIGEAAENICHFQAEKFMKSYNKGSELPLEM